jgi:hypothetical protein
MPTAVHHAAELDVGAIVRPGRTSKACGSTPLVVNAVVNPHAPITPSVTVQVLIGSQPRPRAWITRSPTNGDHLLALRPPNDA